MKQEGLPTWSARFCILFLGRHSQSLTISVVGVPVETKAHRKPRSFPFPAPFCPGSIVCRNCEKSGIQVPPLAGLKLAGRAVGNEFIPLSFSSHFVSSSLERIPLVKHRAVYVPHV